MLTKFFRKVDKRRKYIKLPEAAKLMGVSYSTVYRIIQDSKRGKNNFPYRKYTKNGDYYIPIDEFNKWLDECREN